VADDDVETWLARLADGDEGALDVVIELVHDELRALARRHMRRERSDHTLQTTALVHEAYEKLVRQSRAGFRDRGHFLAVASMCMRRILVNHARDRRRDKRGGDAVRLSLDDAPALASDDRVEEVLAVDALLDDLAAEDPRACRVVECRYFAGLSVEETAEALSTSPRTVKRDWLTAKTWLRARLSAPSGSGGAS